MCSTDPRESIISCNTPSCEHNVQLDIEPHCMLKLVQIKDGMCIKYACRYAH